MRILVTGGTGYLGRALLPILRKKHDVVVFTRRSSFEDYEIFQGDISSLKDVLSVSKSVDSIIHLAVESNHNAPWKRHVKTTILGTRNIVSASSKYGTKLVYLSSTAIFAKSKTNYTRAKLLAEKEVKNISATILRPSSIYDIRRIKLFRKLSHFPLPIPKTYLTPTYLPSLIDSIIASLKFNESKTYNIVDKTPVLLSDFISACAYPRNPFYLPGWMSFPARIIPKVRFMFEDKVFKNDSKKLGVAPVDTLEVVKKIVKEI